MIVSLLILACSEQTIKDVPNSLPTVQIQSHGDNSEFDDGYEIQFYGQVSDLNHENEELQVSWYEGENLICDWETPDPSGVTRCSIIMTEGMERISVQVIDPEQGAGRDEIDVVVNPTDAPTATIFSPQVGGSYYSDQLVLFQGVIADTEDDPEYLTVEWSSSIDGILTLNTTPTSLGEIEDYTTLTSGQHAIKLTVVDTTGKSTVESVVVDVAGPNNEPKCEITLPQSGDAYIIGQNVEFQGVATDEDINNSLLNITWESDIDGIFNSSAALSDGTLTFITNSLSAGNHSIVLRVEDEVGGICTTGTQVSIGTAPNLSVISPMDGMVYSVGDSVSFTATVSDQEDIPSDISLLWTSDIDGELSSAPSDSSGNISFNKSDLSAGLHSLSIVATDSTGLTASDSRSFRVNTPPNTPVITISPTNPYTNEDLVATVTATDDDGDGVTFDYTWLQSGNPTTYTGTGVTAIPSIPSSATSAGETWTLQVTPNDGYTTGTMAQQNVTIENSLPEITSVTIDTTNPYNDDVIQCSTVAEDLDETLSPEFTWTVNASTYTGSSLDLSTTTAMPTDTITCTASVEDAFGETFELSDSVVVENRAPTVDSVTLDQSVAYNDTTLTCSSIVSDPDETPNITYTWQKNGSDLVNGQTIVLSDYNLMPEDEIGCVVVAKDGSNAEDSQETNIVLSNRDPVLAPPVISLTEVEANGTLTCSTTVTDDDGESLTPEYTWTVGNNTPVVVSSITLDPLSALVGSSAVCSIVVNDGYGGSDSKSVQATIINTPPTISTTSITSTGSIEVGETLTCLATGEDINDGILDVGYQWTNETEGTSLGEEETLLLDNSDVQGNDIIKCVATVTDNNNETASSQNTVTVINSGPSFTSEASISPNTGVKTGTALTCTAEASDPNDGTLAVSYNWNVGGVPIGTPNSVTYIVDADETDVGSVIECVAYVEDIDGAIAESIATVTVENTEPTVVSVTLDQSVAYNDSVIDCIYTTIDPDESPNVDVVWTVGGTDLQVTGPLDLATIAALPNDEVICTVTVTDTQLATDSDFASITITNRVPTQPAVSISPSEPVEGVDDLTCSASSTDPDGTTPNYSYEWIQNGNSTSYTTNTIPSSDISAGDTWECIVTPDDDIDFGDSNSASVTIHCSPSNCDLSIVFGNGNLIEFILIEDSDLEDPVGRYTLENAFYMMKTEVSQGVFEEVMDYDSREGKSTYYGDGNDYPAYFVSWHMAADFANTLSTLQGEEECYSCSGSGISVSCIEVMNPYQCSGYSLPTEAEWELAARSGTTSEFWTGEGTELGGMYSGNSCDTNVTIQDGLNNPLLSDYAWFCGNSSQNTSSEIGLQLSNGFGLYDMHGNVWEWTGDNSGCSYSFQFDGTWCSSGSSRIIRGGSYNVAPSYVEATYYQERDPNQRYVDYGFRLRKLFTEDLDNDGVNSLQDCDDNDSTLGSINDDADCDGLLTSEDCDDSDNMDIDIAGDCDQDGITSVDDCDDFDADSTIVSEDNDCDGVPDGCFLTDCDMSVDLGNGIGVDFVLIDELDDPLGRYTLNNNFYMMTTEVTQGMFQQVMGYDSRDGKDTFHGTGDNFPAYYISWHMAADFANTLSTLQGEEECYSCSGSGTSVTCNEAVNPYDCSGFSLPTEHEWELAARSGTTSEFWTGEGNSLGGDYSSTNCSSGVTIQDGVNDPSLSDYAWYCGYNSQEVATKIPNGFGLYDIHGNVFEWTSDRYGCTYPNSGTWCNSGSSRVARGGDWSPSTYNLRLSYRYYNIPAYRLNVFGVRLRKLYNP